MLAEGLLGMGVGRQTPKQTIVLTNGEEQNDVQRAELLGREDKCPQARGKASQREDLVPESRMRPSA